jgi:methyl-accepting chemotaxis protein
MSEIIPNIQKTAQLVSEISASSAELNSGAQQIAKAIDQLSTVTQQNSASSEELSSSSEELASQAEVLKETISFFSIEELFFTNIKKTKKADLSNNFSSKQNSSKISLNLSENETRADEFEGF